MVQIIIDILQLIVIFCKRALTLIASIPTFNVSSRFEKRACAKQEQVRGEGRTSGRQDFNHRLWIDISQWSRRRGSVIRERDVLH